MQATAKSPAIAERTPKPGTDSVCAASVPVSCAGLFSVALAASGGEAGASSELSVSPPVSATLVGAVAGVLFATAVSTGGDLDWR